jgi:hypothetical protein
MAIFKLVEGLTYAVEAGADLSAGLNRFVKINSSKLAVLCGSGDKVLGTVFEVAASAGPVSIQFGGIAKVVAGAAITAGAQVQSDGNGAAITLAAGKAAGVSLDGASAAGVITAVALVSG